MNEKFKKCKNCKNVEKTNNTTKEKTLKIEDLQKTQ